jgi:hypothetical protein
MATSRCVGIEGIASLIRHMILQNGRGNFATRVSREQKLKSDPPTRAVLACARA